MNFLEGRVSSANGTGISFAADGLGTLELPLVAESVKVDQTITVGIRPEHVELEGGPLRRGVKAVVNIVENLGGETYLHVEIAPELPLIMVKLHGSRGPTRGDRIMLHFPADKIYLFDATDSAIPVRILNEEFSRKYPQPKPLPMSATVDKLPKTMPAVMAHGPHDYRLEERPVPRPGPGEVLISVQSTGVCASDIKCYTGAALFWGDEHRVGYCQAPVTPGHEFVGEVVGLGDGAGELYGLKIGDHAISEQIVPCWNCRYCKSGAYWMCNVHDIYGFRQRTFGSWADYMIFPAGALNYKVPDSMPLHHAVFIEPLACSIHAVERGNIKFQDTVVIAGCGPLGLGMVAAAKNERGRTDYRT